MACRHDLSDRFDQTEVEPIAGETGNTALDISRLRLPRRKVVLDS